MKKRIIYLMTLVTFAFVACQDDVVSTAVNIDTSKSASIKIYVKANLDADNTTPLENVPNGTNFIVSINKNELNGDLSAEGMWTKTVSASNGVIETTIPTTDVGVKVYINAIAFEKKVDDNIYVFELTKEYSSVKTGQKIIDSQTLTMRQL